MKINKKLAYPFLIIGGFGWLSGFIVSLSNIETNFEIPLGIASAVTVDSESNIYVTSMFYSSVQSYDKNGSFIRNWRIPSAGGDLNMRCTNDTIQVFSAKVGAILNFSIDGELLERTNTDIRSDDFRNEPKELRTNNGDIYELNGGFLWPTVTKNGSPIIKTKLYLWLFQGPFPAFLFFAMGMGVLVYVNKDKYFKRKTTDA